MCITKGWLGKLDGLIAAGSGSGERLLNGGNKTLDQHKAIGRQLDNRDFSESEILLIAKVPIRREEDVELRRVSRSQQFTVAKRRPAFLETCADS